MRLMMSDASLQSTLGTAKKFLSKKQGAAILDQGYWWPLTTIFGTHCEDMIDAGAKAKQGWINSLRWINYRLLYRQLKIDPDH